MRQLLIVKEQTDGNDALNNGLTDGNVNDLSGLKDGAIAMWGHGSDTAFGTGELNPATIKNFAIALGRPNDQRPFIIPEVDIDTLSINVAQPFKGATFSTVFTMPTTVPGEEYTLRFFKKGVVPHERNSWTVSVVASTNNASYSEAEAFKTAMDSKVNDRFPFTTTRSNGQLTITCNNIGEDWEVVATDSLIGTSLTITHAEKPIGDKKYIQELASFCAAGKGFYHTAAEGREFIPGYPEEVADYELNDSGANRNGTDTTNGKYSTAGYGVFTLRFKVGRDASKTRDERVWQNVYIAVPISETTSDTLEMLISFGMVFGNKELFSNFMTTLGRIMAAGGNSGNGGNRW